ncbi:MAG: CoA-binding protein [Magnetococcales bacterium]|nr:CoA-binding protein [Magnetococcales bacterium]MBF0439277.1 CoA-binding protein [Magnetococcales bacterium]
MPSNNTLPYQGNKLVHPQGEKEFTYFVGIHSLADMATKEDRVCVFNILGGESSTVTPISHEYSGGNIVCGVQPGRSGSVMKTKLGNIPVYNNVLEALNDGKKFNVAVVYVPPDGVKDAVIEAVRVNPDLKKVVILTEKVKVKHARMIRQYCQWRGVDVFGANCLGIGDAHNHVRIGGALGGNAPEESLVPGSIALYSNSGNFTTTIATYLLTAGWGTTVSLSSGKDVYIHFAAPEFTHAMHNDDRSKAAVMYIEPGGYYERDLVFQKPVVACVVGRWKAKLTRSCGHAGAIAGSGDDAMAKEKWFMEKFGVKAIFTPESPACSAKGAVVTNIAHIPMAMTSVMMMNGIRPDFEPRGNLAPKCWYFSSQDIALPKELQLPVVEALHPYNEQIAAQAKQVGAIFPRQAMKDASGASRMDPKSQVSQIHGVSVLDASTHTLEENLVLSLIREYPCTNGRAMANVALNAFVNQSGNPGLLAADAARDAGSSPNVVLSTGVAMIGPNEVKPARDAVQAFVDLFGLSGMTDPADLTFDLQPLLAKAAQDGTREVLVGGKSGKRGKAMLTALENRGCKSVFVEFLKALAGGSEGVRDSTVLAAICCHLGWRPLMRRRLSVTTLLGMPWHFRIFSTLVGCVVPSEKQDKKNFYNVDSTELTESWSFTETAFLSLFGRRPNEEELFSFSVLVGLLVTNGPGTISAQGPKGAVSADGPMDPARVQINKAYLGFLTHTGFAHGGNGYEAIAFLMERFKGSGLTDPGNKNHGLDLGAMAVTFANEYKAYKAKAKFAGSMDYGKIPCVNHPVFKGKPENFDPREVFVDNLFKGRNSYNIFQDFYHQLVHALFKTGVSSNVYCVNVDAVIAVILLKMLWKPYANGEISAAAMENAAFITFLFGRMIGTAAEVDDHTNRGRDMDTRSAASACSYVA